MKALKYALLGFGGLALVAAAVLAYLALTFDPRAYEPRIVEFVKANTGRTLKLAGEIKLSYWPELGLSLGTVSLSERDSSEPFAEVEDARLAVRLRPLLSRELVADELFVKGAHVRITRFADGRLNIDDLLKGEGATPEFDIGRVRLERSAVSYRDLGSDRQYELSSVDLETGRIKSGIPTPLKLRMSVRDGAGTFDIASALQGRLTFDPGEQRYTLDEAAIQVKGRVAGITGVSLELKGSFGAHLKTGELRVTKFDASMNAVLNGEAIQAALETPGIAFGPGHAHVESASAKVQVSGAAGTTLLSLKLPRAERNGDALTGGAASLDLETQRGGHTIRVSIVSPIEASIAGRTLLLNGLESKFAATGNGLPAKGVSGAFTGKASFDFAKEGVQTTLAGTVGESRIKAELQAAGFAAPVYTFAVDIDQLDVDRYAAPGAAREKSGGELDLASLSKLPATGTVRVGVLKSAGVKASNVRLVVGP